MIKMDNKGSRKLYLPRNHSRLVQTSEDMLQSWRGNCDIQILVYDSDPNKINASDIAKVTDYVVSYACKGNKSTQEERQQYRDMILMTQEETKDKSDVVNLVKKLMNRATSNRLISKQECVTLLGGLDLTRCSEQIERVSISNSQKITIDHKDKNRTNNNLRVKYSQRPMRLEHLSLYEYYHYTHNKNIHARSHKFKIPHFLGINGQPCYPVSIPYAKSVIIKHKPWRNNNLHNDVDRDWVQEFQQFRSSGKCPSSVLVEYNRVFNRYITNTVGQEPLSNEVDHTFNDISEEDLEIIQSTGMHAQPAEDFYAGGILKGVNKGEDFDWHKSKYKVS